MKGAPAGPLVRSAGGLRDRCGAAAHPELAIGVFEVLADRAATATEQVADGSVGASGGYQFEYLLLTLSERGLVHAARYGR